MKNKVIGVVMGGPSPEREVSLNTGKGIGKALKARGYQVVIIDLDPVNFVEQLRQANVDIVFNAIHGKFGEDGAMQGALEMLGIPYTGSGVLASALAMDKGMTKRLFLSAGIPTPRSRIYGRVDVKRDLVDEVATDFGFPVVVKPADQGSTIGITIAKDRTQLAVGIKQAFEYSPNILIETFISGKELTVPVWGKEKPEALPIIEIVPHSGFYDYHSKYTKGATEYIIPARIDDSTTHIVQQIAIKVFTLMNCKGITRVDIILDEANNPYVLEINTIPGMTDTSLVPKAAAAAGITYQELCERILYMTL